MNLPKSQDTRRLQSRALRPDVENLEERKLLAAGDLDPSFGVGGKVLALFSSDGYSGARDIAMQSDGKFVVAGELGLRPENALARYNADGSLDTSFGNNGFVQASPDIQEPHRASGSESHQVVTILPDGKILEAGVVAFFDPQRPPQDISFTVDVCLTRFDSNGRLDTSFGEGGFVITHFLRLTYRPAVAVRPDGKIVVAAPTAPEDTGRNSSLALARYNPDGSLDPEFGTGGTTVITSPSGFSSNQPPAIALQPDGNIVIATQTAPPSGDNTDFIVARFNSTGQADPSFGKNGLVTTHFAAPAGARAVALEPDGKIIAAGYAGDDFALARYDSAGRLDPSFGQGGLVTTHFSGPTRATEILLQPSGFFVAGTWRGGAVKPGGFALARYNATGQLDPSFGMGGQVVTLMTPYHQVDTARIFLLPGGKLVLAGPTFHNDLSQVAFARYLGGAVPPPPLHVTSPTVLGLRRFGVHLHPTRLVLSFSKPLDPARASDLANYRLSVAHPRQRLGRPLRLRSAVYDPATQTVTLSPRQRLPLHGYYHLVVSGEGAGITDLAGDLLDGNGDNQPGGDYVTTFGPESFFRDRGPRANVGSGQHGPRSD